MKISFSKHIIRQYVVVLIGNLAILTSGMSLAWPSPVVVKLQSNNLFPRPVTNEEISWIVSGGFLFSVFLNISGGIIVDKIGRKYCTILISVPKICVIVWSIFVTEVWMLMMSRAIWLICDCFVFVIMPIYVSEIASKEHRGPLGIILQLFSCLGIVITLSVGPFMSYTVLNTFIAIVIAITSIPMLFLPESPYYLYSKGHEEAAIKVLRLLRESETRIKEEIEEYKMSSKGGKIDKIALFKNKTFCKSLLLGILVSSSCNFVGFSSVSFYLQTIFNSTQTNLRSEIASVIIGCIEIFAAICSSFVSTTFGRRTILIASMIGIFCGMIGLGTFFEISMRDDYVIVGFMNYLPIISVMLIIFSHSAGIGSLIWPVVSELFDRQYRAFGVTISISIGTFYIFVTSKFFPLITTAIGPSKTYFFYATMCFLFGSLITVFLPETKGKSIKEIQAAISGNILEKKNQEGSITAL